MICYVALGFVAFLLYLVVKDLLFPLMYQFRAKRRGYRVPEVLSDTPFGIRNTYSFVKAASQERLLLRHEEMERETTNRTSLRQLLFRWVVRTREPENIKTILATGFNDFCLVRPYLLDAFGSGIFTQNGTAWKHSRTMLRPQFSKEQISRLDSLIQRVDILARVVKERQQAGFVVDMQHYFHLFTMDTATEFLFGESVNSLLSGPETRGAAVTDPKTGEVVMSADFVDSYRQLNEHASYGSMLNSLQWLLKYIRPAYMTHKARAHAFVDHYVQKALEATANMSPEEKEAESNEYVFSHELAKITRDPLVIRDQIFNILIAGRDTTASTLSYSFYYFAKYPEELAKVRAEILALLPEGAPVTYESLRKLQYLQYFIKEVLRMAPVVPVNMRVAVRDTSLPRGGGVDGNEPIFVPKGTRVVYPIFLVHRDPEIYGDDVHEFKPSRWSPENKRPDSAMYSWGYLPFNGGPRICLGQQFALTEIALTIVKLLHVFDTVEPAPGFPENDRPDRLFLTLQMGGRGVPVRLLRRNP